MFGCWMIAARVWRRRIGEQGRCIALSDRLLQPGIEGDRIVRRRGREWLPPEGREIMSRRAAAENQHAFATERVQNLPSCR